MNFLAMKETYGMMKYGEIFSGSLRLWCLWM